MKKLNRRGAALANIMLISAFVMVMATTIISLALNNYRMKLINMNSKNNFYSCEAILDQMRVGFRNDMVYFGKTTSNDAAAFEEFYKKYILYYSGSKTGVEVRAGSTEKPDNYHMYSVLELVNLLPDIEGSEYTVVSKMEEYNEAVGASYVYGCTLTANVKGAEVTVDIISDPSEYNFILHNDYVEFKNLTVSYEQNGYLNSISTDIKINYLEKTNVSSFSAPLENFSIISFGGFGVGKPGDNAGNLVVCGDMYVQASSRNTKISESESEEKKQQANAALYLDGNVNNGTIVSVCLGDVIILDGDIVVKNGAILDFPKSTKVFINGSIYVDSKSVFNISEAEGVSTNIYITDMDADGKQHGIYASDSSGIVNNNHIKTISLSDFPFYSWNDILAEANVREINGKEFCIGTSNSNGNKFYGEPSNATGDFSSPVSAAGVFTFASSTTASVGGDKTNKIIVFRNDNPNNDYSAISGTFTGMIISRNNYKISTQNGNSDVNSVKQLKPYLDANNNHMTVSGLNGQQVKVQKAAILLPLKDIFLDILENEIKLSGGWYTTSNNYVGEIQFPAKYLFVNEGRDIEVSIESSEGTDTSEITKSSALSISYSGWQKE